MNNLFSVMCVPFAEEATSTVNRHFCFFFHTLTGLCPYIQSGFKITFQIVLLSIYLNVFLRKFKQFVAVCLFLFTFLYVCLPGSAGTASVVLWNHIITLSLQVKDKVFKAFIFVMNKPLKHHFFH